MKRIALVKYYSAKGFITPEIKDMLYNKHSIEIGAMQIREDLKNIKNGKYENSWLDELLDLHYPEIYQNIMKELNWTEERIKHIADTTENPRLALQALKAYNNVNLSKMMILHKGPIIREMRKLKAKSRKLVEELAQERSITRKNTIDDTIVGDIPTVSPPPPGMEEDVHRDVNTEGALSDSSTGFSDI